MPILSDNEFGNLIFFLQFLNKDISYNIQKKVPSFEVYVDDSQEVCLKFLIWFQVENVNINREINVIKINVIKIV